MTRTVRFLLLFQICVTFVGMCNAKPTEVLSNLESLNPVRQQEIVSVESASNREQRSPQFGFSSQDYSEYEDQPNFEYRHKHKPNKHHHKPGGYGPHLSGIFGGYKPPEYYHPHPHPPPPPPPSHGGGSFATASAGSIDSSGKPYGGQNYANAQSASFSFGPYTASFSLSEASSGGQNY